ncbi:hypothetical protein CXU14_11360 [Akkermansia muciniphila]|nr:hypothetical protein CXU16_04220 [Akkermansia muciniphila]PNC42213.1 hypothetical protein CXU14_11360 [Akkermansia muciniphila]
MEKHGKTAYSPGRPFCPHPGREPPCLSCGSFSDIQRRKFPLPGNTVPLKNAFFPFSFFRMGRR